MKYNSHMLLKWAVVVVVLSLPWVDSAGQREERGPRGSLRRRRSACQDGSYTVGGKTCCLCAAGQRLSQHCGDTPEDRVCEYCDPGKTYSSVPNAWSTCEPCTSCTQPWANLEVKEECTITKDAVCQCREDHYCNSTLCTTCNPCDKCEGRAVKSPCTGTTNTVCWMVLGPGLVIYIVICLIVLIGTIVMIVVSWKRCFCFRTSWKVKAWRDETSPETKRLLNGVNLKPHVKEIAEELRWKDVWYIARKSGFTRDSIFDIMKDNRYTKWTPLLLDQWVEKMKMKGNNAARVLLEKLTDLGHTYQRDSVIRILEERNLPRFNIDQSILVPSVMGL